MVFPNLSLGTPRLHGCFCVRFCASYPIGDCAATSARYKSAQSKTEKRIHLRFSAKNEGSGNGPLEWIFKLLI
jgi:hypothetical protein